MPPRAQTDAVTGLIPILTPVIAESIFTANNVQIPQAAEKRSERKNFLLLIIEKSIMIPEQMKRPTSILH